MPRHWTPTRHVVAWSFLLCAPTAWADLATDETSPTPANPVKQETGASPTGLHGARATTATGTDPNRSVELLLQLQDRADLTSASARKSNAGTAGPESRSMDASKASELADPAATALKQLKTAVLSDRNQSNSSTSTRSDETRAGNSSPSRHPQTSDAPGPSDPGSGVAESHPAVRFLRENRGAILAACVALLGIIGLATVLPNRRR